MTETTMETRAYPRSTERAVERSFWPIDARLTSEGRLRRLDLVGLIFGVIITLGPLAATAMFDH